MGKRIKVLLILAFPWSLVLACALIAASWLHCEYPKKITNFGYSVVQYTEPDKKTVRYRVITRIDYSDGTKEETLYAVETVEPKEGKHAIRNARHRAVYEGEKWMDKVEDSLAEEK